MTVLPYVTISIVSGLGSLDLAQAKTLGLRVGLVLLLLWTVAIVCALLVVTMFPVHESASFFSVAMLEDRERFDFLSLYIPTNPFNSLANNIVPAVVLFSLVVGAALTPVPFRAVVSRTRNALVLAFMTTSLFAVLPLLTEAVKSLLREYAGQADGDDSAEAMPDVIVPASFNFPHSGKLLSLSFIPFAAWFSDTALPFSAYVKLGTTGLVVMFGNVNAAIPFLLDLVRIPSDTFQLFLTS